MKLATWQRAALATCGSLALHGALLIYLVTSGATPDLGFELELPSEVEFGLTEAASIDPTTNSAAATTEPQAPDQATGQSSRARANGESADASVGDAEVRDADLHDAEVADAGVHDASRNRPDAGIRAEQALPVASADEPSEVDSGVARRDASALAGSSVPPAAGTGRLPPGAQIAIRLNMARIRTSALAPDFTRLLSAIPDWQALLEGSGVDPVQDIERLLIASPNMQRSKIVLAGRYEGDPRIIERTVARMAEARGVEARWRRRRDGIRVAPWPNQDETERLIAHVGPRDFIISRPEDLPRVLAVARARQQRGDDPQESANTGPEALLSMGSDEAFTFEVEGAQQFVRGTQRGIPSRVRIAVANLPNQHVAFRGAFFYESADQAEEGLTVWEQIRDRYARNTLVRLSGLGGVLQNTDLEREGSTLRFDTTLSPAHMRLLMGYLEGALGRPQSAPPANTP